MKINKKEIYVELKNFFVLLLKWSCHSPPSLYLFNTLNFIAFKILNQAYISGIKASFILSDLT